MSSNFTKATSLFAVLAIFAITVLTAVPFSSVSPAEAKGSGPAPVDMETDEDENGIPDEFEKLYGDLLSDLSEIGHGEDMTDVSETESYKLMKGFYDRLPIAASTKAILETTADRFEKLASTEDVAKQQELYEKIQEEERRVLAEDSVYVDVKGYIAQIMTSKAGDGVKPDTDPKESAGSIRRSNGILAGRSLDGSSIAASLTVSDNEEDEINRVGDILFKKSSPGHRGSFSPMYTMKWGHIALYDGDSQIYDAHPDNCAGSSTNGVGLRPLSRIYENADSVMYAQLDNLSWRWSQAGALQDAQDSYGIDCRTPFTRNVFAMSGTSKFFCSMLVWRVYLDNDNYSVNVDGNAAAYHQWLQEVWPDWLAAIIIINTVAPDEIALSSYIDDYRTLD